MEEIGAKIKTLRKSRKFTLKDVAERAGCTNAYISQIEKGIVSPSISLLKNIATAFGIRLVDLFLVDEEADDEIIIRRGEGFEIKYPRGDASISLLVKNLEGKNMQPLVARFNPKSGSEGLYAHGGGQEFGYVLSGELDLMIEDKVYNLKRGDTFYFNSTRPHGYINHSEEITEVLWVISPPTY